MGGNIIWEIERVLGREAVREETGQVSQSMKSLERKPRLLLEWDEGLMVGVGVRIHIISVVAWDSRDCHRLVGARELL